MKVLVFLGRLLLALTFSTLLTACHEEKAVKPDNLNMADASKVVVGLDQAVAMVKEKTGLTVLFPQTLPEPAEGAKYYAYADPTQPEQGRGYQITIDKTPDCHGVKVCNIGMIRSQLQSNPQIYYSMQNQPITQTIILKNGTRTYFTPGHAMGDYWPPMISWRDGPMLYTLSWDLKPEVARAALIQMASNVSRFSNQ